VRHGALHAPHLPLERGGDGAVVALPVGVLAPQLLVAVVARLRAVGEHRATAHVARLPPVLAVAGVRVQVTAHQLGAAALVRAGDQLVGAAHAVAVLLRQREGVGAATDLVATLRGWTKRGYTPS